MIAERLVREMISGYFSDICQYLTENITDLLDSYSDNSVYSAGPSFDEFEYNYICWEKPEFLALHTIKETGSEFGTVTEMEQTSHF